MSLHHEEYLHKKRKKKFFRWFAVFLIFISIVLIISFLSHRRQIRIAFVELSGGVLVTQNEVSPAALRYLSGSYMWLFPKNNIIWYPKKSLEQFLEKEFPRIATIDMSARGGPASGGKNYRTLAIVISERKPAATWCTESDKCYFLDSNGTIFAEAPYFSGDAYFRYYGFIASTTQPIGQNYLRPEQFAQVSSFIDSVRTLGLKPTSLLAQYGQFTLKLSSDTKIIFDLKENSQTLSSTLSALMRAKDFPSDVSKIDYIDLRFGNKLFYKLK